MAALLAILMLLAPDEAKAEKVPELQQLLKDGKQEEALALLKEIGKLKGNHAEAEALVKLVRGSRRMLGQPEVLEASFLALKGIASREVTRELLRISRVSSFKKEPVVRLGICRALEGSEDPDGIPYILDSIADVDDHVAAGAAQAAAVHRHAKEEVRKELFEQILKIYVPTWNLKMTSRAEDKIAKARAERKWEVIEAPMERSLQLLSNVSEPDPPSWQRWWNKHKNERWAAVEN